MNIVLLAPPAAGKGTQALELAKRFGLVHISTGNLFRERIKVNDELAQELSNILASGSLVNDEIVLEILSSRILEEDCQKGFILDGFPRTLNQGEKLNEILDAQNRKLDYVFYLKVEKETLEKRISGRRMCTKCGKIYNIYNEASKPRIEGVCDTCNTELVVRKDDNIEVYSKRYNEYQEKTTPLINYYQDHNLLITIDGDRNVNEITEEIATVMKRDELSD